MNSNQYEVAKFEVQVLQSIIARHEEHTFKIRSWLFAVLGAITLAFYTESMRLSPYNFLNFSVVTIVLFFIWEIFQREPKRLAIERSRKVEKILRTCLGSPGSDEISYDGPMIAEAFYRKSYNPIEEAKIPQVWVPYVFALLATLILWGCKPLQILSGNLPE